MHRDIKPQNILLNKKGDVKLSDLGLVIKLESSIGTSTFAGTKIYEAPEIYDQYLIEGTNQIDFTSKADVWGLGITLIEIARFHHPYDYCEREIEVIYDIASSEVQPPNLTQEDGYGEELIEVVNKMVIKDLDLRPRLVDLVEMNVINSFQDLEGNKRIMEEYIKEYIGENEDLVEESPNNTSTLQEVMHNMNLS